MKGLAFLLFCLLASGLAFCAGWMELDSARASKALTRLPAGVVAHPSYTKGKLASVSFEGNGLQKAQVYFSLLDSLNGNGEWHEIDAQGWLEKSLALEIRGARQSWFSRVPGQTPIVAVRKDRVLKARSLPGFQLAPAVPLVYRYQGGLAPFADFERYEGGGHCGEGDPCNLIHREEGQLQAIVEGKHVRMGYRHPDAQILAFPGNYRTLSPRDRLRTVREFRDYFRHEFSVMLRAFVHSTPGLFNWQTWQWPAYAEKNLISEAQLDALFSTGHAPSLYQVLQLRCQGGQTVRFETDGNGQYYMEVK